MKQILNSIEQERLTLTWDVFKWTQSIITAWMLNRLTLTWDVFKLKKKKKILFN